MGIDITKKIVPTSATTDGLDPKKYLIVSKNMLVFSGMQTGRDISIRLAIHTDDNPRAYLLSLYYFCYQRFRPIIA